MNFGDVQGNVLDGYKTDHANYAFARITDPVAAREWLRSRLGLVTFEGEWVQDQARPTLNIAFTCAGLVKLGCDPRSFEHLEAFAAGMKDRAEGLGDMGESAPHRWQPELRDTHVLVVQTAWKKDGLPAAVASLEAQLKDAGSGLERTWSQDAKTPRNRREHFGFSDGFSQPAVAGAKTGPREGEGVPMRKWSLRKLGFKEGWRELAPGEFVLGHDDEGGSPAPAPPHPLDKDSSFMVVRKLRQDVIGFRRYCAQQAEQHKCHGDRVDANWIAAKMVGRWQNGSPLALFPEEPGPDAKDQASTINNFRYRVHDAAGYGCPIGSHVRRANPRDALGWEGKLSMRHRLIRRGMSYGKHLADDADDNSDDAEEERGLMFICYQASIERQFEFVQRQWLGDGNVFGLAGDRDPISATESPTIGHSGSSAQMVVQGNPPMYLTGIPRFVTTRGGDYFLLPGRAGLRALAEGSL